MTIESEDLRRLRLLEKLSGGKVQEKSLIASEDNGLPVSSALGSYGLSSGQERLWFLNKLNEHDANNLISGKIHFKGALNGELLKSAIERVILRHDILRARFFEEDGRPRQRGFEGRNFKFSEMDVSELRSDEQDTAVHKIERESANSTMSLERGPLLHFTLIKTSEDGYVLIMTIHHIVFDNWSSGVFLSEVGSVYSALKRGEPIGLAVRPVQYRDFIEDQAAYLKSKDYNAARGYWESQMEGAPVMSSLASDRLRPSIQDHVGEELRDQLSDVLTSRIKALARKSNATVYMIMLAAFKITLSALNGQSDNVIGTPMSGRESRRYRNSIGFFVHSVALRSSIIRSNSYAAYLEDMKRVTLTARSHQALPFEQLVEMSEVRRDLSFNPVFQVMMAFQNMPSQDFAFEGLTVEILPVQKVTSQFDFTLFVEPSESRIELILEYAASVFSLERMENFVSGFQRVLELICDDPNLKISELCEAVEQINTYGDKESDTAERAERRGVPFSLKVLEDGLTEVEGVEDAAVFFDTNDPDKLLAFCKVSSEKNVAERRLRLRVEERIPAFMMPDNIYFVEELPLDAMGAADRNALMSGSLGAELDIESAFTGSSADRDDIVDVLLRAWKAVLKNNDIKPSDNFFEIGGDSIQSIQVVALAKVEGVHITPRQMFERQSLSELAAVAQRGVSIDAEQGLVTGGIPLTPIQKWFLTEDVTEPDHYHQAILLKLNAEMPVEQLELAVTALYKHHDILRAQFNQGENGWVQSCDGEAVTTKVSTLNVNSLDAENLQDVLNERFAEIKSGYDLRSGGAFEAVLIEVDGESSPYLLLVCHHLVIDGMSWRILAEDIFEICAGHQSGQVYAPQKTSSYKAWSEQLEKYQGLLDGEEWRKKWSTAVSNRLPLIAVDPDVANCVSSERKITITLSQKETTSLLSDVPSAFRTQVMDIFLCAFVRAAKWHSGFDVITIDLEEHGRSDRFERLDISRTVGWFTNIYPLALHLSGGPELEDDIQAIKDQHRIASQDSLSYLVGKTKFGGDDSPREVLFNYLGKLDMIEGNGHGPTVEAIEFGPPRPGNSLRKYEIEVISYIESGQLKADWFYNPKRHSEDVIQNFADRYLKELSELISYCMKSDGGVSITDFELLFDGEML